MQTVSFSEAAVNLLQTTGRHIKKKIAIFLFIVYLTSLSEASTMWRRNSTMISG